MRWHAEAPLAFSEAFRYAGACHGEAPPEGEKTYYSPGLTVHPKPMFATARKYEVSRTARVRERCLSSAVSNKQNIYVFVLS